MSVYLASVYATERHVGQCYCTAVKNMVGYGVTATVDCLVPTKELVWGHRYQGMSDQEYTDKYFKLLSSRWEAVRAWLKSLDNAVDITLLCWCSEGRKFCHRKLIARVINRYRPDITVVLH